MKRQLLSLALPLLFAAAPALANTFSFTNDTTATGLTFNRTTEPGDLLSLIGTAVPYYSQPFNVTVSGSYNLSLVADAPASHDTFLSLYHVFFNPAQPLNFFQAANDDATGNPDLGSAITSSLVAGDTYFFVANGYGNSDAGPFHALISGSGNIASVPEPSTYALAGLGLAGLWLARHRRIAAL